MELLKIDNVKNIINESLKSARKMNLNPIMVVVLDHRGSVIGCLGENGISPLRFKIAFGKANGAFQMSMGSRSLFKRAEEQAYFVNSINSLLNGELIPVPGGVLIRNKDDFIVGSVGISGDNSDNDEKAAIAGIENNGFKADKG